MTQGRRVKLSEQQRNDMWRRWKTGQSLHEIGRVFGKDHVSIEFMLAQTRVRLCVLLSSIRVPSPLIGMWKWQKRLCCSS